MNKQSSLRYFVALLFAALAVAALGFAGLGALAQNTNTSTSNTGEAGAQNANDNATPTRRGRGRRGRRPPANANTDAADANANTGDATTTPADNANAGAAAQDDDDTPRDLSGERVDLSGTYAGRVMTSGGHEMSGEATLTITGNTFTLTGEGMTHNGRVYAVLTRGATSAAFYFADVQDAATNTPVVFNVRVRKSGERLTLSPAPNTRNRMTFAPAGGRRGRG